MERIANGEISYWKLTPRARKVVYNFLVILFSELLISTYIDTIPKWAYYYERVKSIKISTKRIDRNAPSFFRRFTKYRNHSSVTDSAVSANMCEIWNCDPRLFQKS